MKLTPLLLTVFLIAITTVSVMAQTSTPEYKSPLTIEQLDVTYTVNEDGTYTQDTKTIGKTIGVRSSLLTCCQQ